MSVLTLVHLIGRRHLAHIFHVCTRRCSEKAAQTYVLDVANWGYTVKHVVSRIYGVWRTLSLQSNIGQGVCDDGCLTEVLQFLDSTLFMMRQRLFDFISCVGVLNVALNIEVDFPFSLGETEVEYLVFTLGGLNEMFRCWSYIIRVTLFEIRANILKEIHVVLNRVYVRHEWCHISRRGD